MRTYRIRTEKGYWFARHSNGKFSGTKLPDTDLKVARRDQAWKTKDWDLAEQERDRLAKWYLDFYEDEKKDRRRRPVLVVPEIVASGRVPVLQPICTIDF